MGLILIEFALIFQYCSCFLVLIIEYHNYFQKSPLMKVWFKQDDTFFVPKVCAYFQITRYEICGT